MDQQVIDIIKDKLEKYGLRQYDNLTSKQKERLYRIQDYIDKNDKEFNRLFNEINRLKLNKVNIANSKEVGVSRKTLYNDTILLKYIEGAIKEQNSLFDRGKIINLQNDINFLQNKYNNMIDKTIENNLYLIEIEECKKQIKALYNDNNKLREILRDISNDRSKKVSYLNSIK